MSSNRLLATLLASAAILWPIAGNAAVTYLGSGQAARYNGAGSTVVITLTHAVPIGGLVELGSIQDTAGTYCTGAVDSRGNSYTTGSVSDFLGARYMRSFSAIVTTALLVGDTITTTCASASNKMVMEASFSGIDTASPRDLPPTHGDSTTATSNSTTEGASNAQAGNLVIGWGFVNSSFTNITGDNFTNQVYGGDSTMALVYTMSYAVAPTTAALTWTTTYDASRAYLLYVEAFKPAAGGVTLHNRALMGVGQ